MPGPTRLIASFARAGMKAVLAKLRGVRAAKTHPQWAARAAACERCHLKVVKCGVSYCGKPFLRLPVRDDAVDGCGCPTRAKAKDPAEHCPITRRLRPASRTDATPLAGHACDCTWCDTARAAPADPGRIATAA